MRGLVFYCKAAPLSEGLRSGQERIVSRRGGLSSQNAIDHGRFCSDLAPVGERPQVSNDEGLWVTRAAPPFLAAVSRARWDGSASHTLLDWQRITCARSREPAAGGLARKTRKTGLVCVVAVSAIIGLRSDGYASQARCDGCGPRGSVKRVVPPTGFEPVPCPQKGVALSR